MKGISLRLSSALPLVTLSAIALGWSVPDPAYAATTVDDPAHAPRQSVEDEREPTIAELCSQPGSFRDEWLDLVQEAVYFSVCGPVTWFDSLFGSARRYQDTGGTYGRLGVLPFWDRHGGLDARLRLSGRLALPVLEDRLDMLVGIHDEQAMIDGRDDRSVTPLPSSFRRFVRDESWLVGLGYSGRRAQNHDLSFGGGLRVGAPLDPYLNAAYRHDFVLDARTLLRVRETLFWRQSRRFGSTTQVSLDRLIGPERMVRWEGVATIAGDTSGVEWSTTAHLFQGLGGRRAVDLRLIADGETGQPVSLRSYGAEAVFRMPVARPWLFLEVTSSLTWPRETPLEQRRMSPGFGVGFEMYFGPVPPRELN